MNPNLHLMDAGILNIIEEIKADGKVALIVPKRLIDPDPAIIAAQRALRSDKPYTLNGLLNTQPDQLDIKVSPKNIDRALRFMDTLLKSFKARGHEIDITWRNTYVQLFKEVREEIKLREQTTKLKVQDGGSARHTPIGKLYFCAGIGCSRRWVDGKDPIEDKIALIIASLEFDAKRLIDGWEKQRIQRKAEEEQARRVLEIKRLEEKELHKFKKLLRTATREQEVEMIRKYIRNVESQAVANNTLTENLKAWILWASGKADWYDPHLEANDETLRDIDRDTLT